MNRPSLAVLPLIALLGIQPRGHAQQPGACCVITGIDAAAGVVSARESATGNVFEFKARNPAIVATLRVGQTVQANFARGQVSLDGRTVCCTIMRASGAPAAAAARPVAGAAATTVARLPNLPPVTYADPIPAANVRTRGAGPLLGATRRTVNAKVQGRDVSVTMLHLNGREAIDKSDLPDGARNLLAMHVRKLKQKESEYYIVNPQLAAEWSAAHPAAAKYKPKKEEKDDSECGKLSVNGFKDCGSDAIEATQEELERARKRAEDWWEDSVDKLAKELNEAAGCFTDHTLRGPTTPVTFSIAPSVSVNVSQSSSRRGARGQVSGTATLGIPMQGDFQAGVDFFYIPCMPFVFRPKTLSADGTMTVGQQVTLDVVADGSFEKTFTIPPAGGPQIPLYVIPIVIGNVPVAVIDVSAYIEGELNVKGEGKATGRLALTNSNTSKFEFECSGGGCKGTSKGNSPPVTTSESAQIEGELSVEPGIFTALQLSFDYNVLQGRAGPQPYLLGVANGCGAVAATQQSGSASTTATNAALVADLDWGIKLRAEALAGGQKIGNRWETKAMDERHIWFRDMAPSGSTALQPQMTAPAQVTAGTPAAIAVKMPTCYPYSADVHYRVAWTGASAPQPAGGSCTPDGTGLDCKAAPAKDLVLRFTWPSAGAQTVTVQLRKDDHRNFSTPPATLTVNVGSQ